MIAAHDVLLRCFVPPGSVRARAALRLVGRRRAPERCRATDAAASQVYGLTDWGAELETVIVQLGRWGARSPSLDRESGLSSSSAVLSMRTMFRPEAAGGATLRLLLDLGERRFRATVAGDRLEVLASERAAASGDPAELGGVDAVVTAAPAVLAGLLYDGLDLDDALASGVVRVAGDLDAVRRYLDCFWLPDPAPGVVA